jgi:hypothetical protein
MHNRHTQKTQPLHAAKTERKREHVFIRISISNKTPQTIKEKREPFGLPPWKGQ